jgi:ferredoxin
MANPKKRVPENVPGDFFVDSTCIDCDACRQIAPSTFGEAAETSFVKARPVANADRRRALQALLACPTGSIGCIGDDDVKAVMKDFPLVIEEPVYYCGYNSPKSYGGNSYFIKHPAGNWLIDSPKFVTPLVQQLEALGGIAHIFLTHRDDVADARRCAEHFGSRRIIHRSSFRPPRTTAGIRGRGRPSRSHGWQRIASSGSCQSANGFFSRGKAHKGPALILALSFCESRKIIASSPLPISLPSQQLFLSPW